jgi:4'-phosphopantetheinyl transferase
VDLTPGEVHVWRVALGHPRPTHSFSPDELARLERIRHPRTRREFARARSALRHLLSLYLGAPAPAFSHNAYGKPELPSPAGLHFNVSHSGDWAMIALARDPVGVDVEDHRRSSDLGLLARHSFAPDELDLPDLTTPDGRRAFFHVWSRKEAYIKALGMGLSLDLSCFAVSHDEPARVLRHAPDAPPLALASAHPDPSHSGAVCARRLDRVLTYELPPPDDQ